MEVGEQRFTRHFWRTLVHERDVRGIGSKKRTSLRRGCGSSTASGNPIWSRNGSDSVVGSAAWTERPSRRFTETIVELNPGDAFTLYTDGLFGGAITGRLRSTPTQLAGMINPFAVSAEALLELMLNAATPDSPKSPPDDVAAVTVRRSN